MPFPTTNWTVLAHATVDGDTSGQRALAHFCENYHSPVLVFLRSRGFEAAEAADFTQEFFLELLRSRAWKRAEQSKGRFRTFLLGTLMHVIGRHRARASAGKRGGGWIQEDIDALDGCDQPAVALAASGESFDREWALLVMERALKAVESSVIAAHSKKHWELLRQFLPGAGVPHLMRKPLRPLGSEWPGPSPRCIACARVCGTSCAPVWHARWVLLMKSMMNWPICIVC